MNAQKLGLSEYTDTLLDSVSSVIISDYEYSSPENELKSIIYKMWQSYHGSDLEVSIKRDALILEAVLYYVLK